MSKKEDGIWFEVEKARDERDKYKAEVEELSKCICCGGRITPQVCQGCDKKLSEGYNKMALIAGRDNLKSLNAEMLWELKRAADTFKSYRQGLEILGKRSMAEGLEIAEQATRATIAKAEKG